MARPHAPAIVPRWFLIGAAALLLATIAAAAGARYQRLTSGPAPVSPVAVQVELRFDHQADGSVLLRRQPDDRVIEVLPADGSGFMRGVLRSLERDRALRRLDPTAPYALLRRENGRQAIVDSLSGRGIELDGFGPSHSEAVGRLIDTGSRRADQAQTTLPRQ